MKKGTKIDHNEMMKCRHYVSVQSRIHKDVYHTGLVDLYCYERMPKESAFKNNEKFKSDKKTAASPTKTQNEISDRKEVDIVKHVK